MTVTEPIATPDETVAPQAVPAPGTTPAPHDGALVDPAHDDVPLVADELLVEEISIDGMCGVY